MHFVNKIKDYDKIGIDLNSEEKLEIKLILEDSIYIKPNNEVFSVLETH